VVVVVVAMAVHRVHPHHRRLLAPAPWR